jgi:hypothetical protein
MFSASSSSSPMMMNMGSGMGMGTMMTGGSPNANSSIESNFVRIPPHNGQIF